MFVFGVAVVLCVLASAHAQVMDIGACRNYQSSNSFTKKFIQKITESGEGYAVALSTESAIPCQQLRLFSNGTFVYSMGMADGNTRTFEGPFTAKTSSFNEAGYLDLDIPARVFGNGLLGNLRLYVLMTSDDYLVVAACWPLTVLRVENIYAMVPNSKFKINTAAELNTTLTKAGVPHTNRFHEVFQICNGTVPEPVQEEFVVMMQRQVIPANITFPNPDIINRDKQTAVCINGTLVPYDTCRQLLTLSDAIGYLLLRTPIPICRPIYKEIFQLLCEYDEPTIRTSLDFIHDDNNYLQVDSLYGLPAYHRIGLPTTSSSHSSSHSYLTSNPIYLMPTHYADGFGGSYAPPSDHWNSPSDQTPMYPNRVPHARNLDEIKSPFADNSFTSVNSMHNHKKNKFYI